MNFPATGGTLTFNNVDGAARGTKTLRFRFSNGGTAARTGSLVTNGVAQNISFPTTADWNTWAVVNATVVLQSGMTNTVQVRSTGQDLANLDELLVP